MKKMFYETPTQVAFFDVDNNQYIGGIAYKDEIICGCCGGIVPIEEVYEYAPDDIVPIRDYSEWVDINEAICGDEKPNVASVAERLASYLQGSCKSFSEACEALGIDENSLTEADLAEFDEYVFQCDVCGWWEDIGDKHDFYDDALCNDCFENEVYQD